MVRLNVIASMQLLKKYGIPVVEQENVVSEQQIENACRKIGFPAAMKVVSPKAFHKTELGGIKLNIHSVEEAKQAFNELKKLEMFESVLMQKQLKGREVIIGGKWDGQFGPTILFGLGGIFVEIFEDISMRLCPITERDAEKMLREIKGYKILQGARGEKPANFKAIKDVLMKTSRMMVKEKIRELDINPLIVDDKKAVAVDARAIL